MASIEDFVQSPSERLLNSYKKEQLLQVADHFGVEVSRRLSKDDLLVTLKARLVEDKILAVRVESEKTPVGMASVSDVDFPNPSLPGKGPSVVPVLAGFGAGLSFEQQKELLLLQLQQEQRHVLELEKLKHDARLREAEMAHAQARQQLELERYKLDLMSQGKLQTPEAQESVFVPPAPAFDVAVSLRLVPKFNEKDPDIFFVLFERLAEARNWSDTERILLLQCVFTGKAQEVFSALSVADSGSYLLVKAAVLKAYELVPEAYRQRFRSGRKEKQTHTEFAHDLAVHFQRWCASSQVKTFEDLQELILLEQFKNTLPDRVVTYLNEQKVTKVSEAAQLADEFVLTHKGFFGDNRGRGDAVCRESSGGVHSSGKCLSEGTAKFPVKGDRGVLGKLDSSRVCNYCSGKGHWKNECPVLRRKVKPGYLPTKPSAAAVTVGAEERASVIAAVQAHTKPSYSESMGADPDVNLVQTGYPTDVIDPGYLPFVSDGFVSLVGVEDRVPVKILRDPGALDSFILDSVLPFSTETYSGTSVGVRGMGLTVFFCSTA